MNRLYIPNFFGGINQSVDSSYIKFNESPNCYNCDTTDGLLSTGTGYSKKWSNRYGSTPIPAIAACYVTNIDSLIFAAANGLWIIDYTGYQQPNPLVGGMNIGNLDFINFETLQGNAFMTANGIEPIRVFNGAYTRFLLDRRITYNDDGSIKGYIDANGVFHTTEADITTYAPPCRFIELYHDRVFGAGDAAHPNRLYYSTVGQNGADPDDWTYPIEEGEANMHGGWEDLPTYDGGNIVGLKNIFGDLVIFKESTIIKLYGTYPGNYSTQTLFSSNGTISDKSIVFGSNRCFFADYDGIYQYDGVNVLPIHMKVKGIVKRFNTSALNKCVAAFYDNKYFLAVPIDGSTVNNALIVFDTINSTFTVKYNVFINSMVEFRNELLFVNNDGYIYKFDTSKMYDTNPIDMHWESLTYDGQAKNIRKIADYLYFVGKGNGDVKFTIKTDKKTIERQFTLTSDMKEYKKRINISGRDMKLMIDNVNGSDISIKAPEITLELEED